MSNDKDKPTFSMPIRVYYEDTDAAGVVYYANYLKYMERVRTEWVRNLGCELDELRRQAGLLFAVRRAEVEYLRPAWFNDMLVVTLDPIAYGGASMDMAHEVRREADATLCCRARIKIVCVNEKTMRPGRIPEQLRAEVSRVC